MGIGRNVAGVNGSTRVIVYVSPGLGDAIEEAAKAAGMDVNDWLRQTLTEVVTWPKATRP